MSKIKLSYREWVWFFYTVALIAAFISAGVYAIYLQITEPPDFWLIFLDGHVLGVLAYYLMKRFYDVSDPGYIHTIVVSVVGAIFGGLVFIVFGFSADAPVSLFILAGFLAVMLIGGLLRTMDRDWSGWLPAIVAFIAGGAAVNAVVFGLLGIPAEGWIG